MTPKYYVATYGDLGIEVEFYDHPDAYDEAVKDAETAHQRGNIDTYTCGEVR